jgi:hypothetical protein
VSVAHNPIVSDRSRHINVKHRKVQELIEDQVMNVEWISTKDQVADILTKQMPRTQFEYLRSRLHILPSIIYCFCLASFFSLVVCMSRSYSGRGVSVTSQDDPV